MRDLEKERSAADKLRIEEQGWQEELQREREEVARLKRLLTNFEQMWESTKEGIEAVKRYCMLTAEQP